MKNRIITIDGPAGSGKSTVSRLVATRISCLYLDTGAMYRAVALEAKRKGIDPGDREKIGDLCRNLSLIFETEGDITRLYLGDEDISAAIRTPEMDILSSRISAVREVRTAMTDLQRKIGSKGNVVAEGRDMGTVVFPEADHKFFITASPEIRAERRYRERAERGESVSRAQVARELKERDDQDTKRSIAPLRPAKDAELIDTTELNSDQAVERILICIEDKNDD